MFALDSLIAPHETSANNPNIRIIKADLTEIRVYKTPLTQHLVDVAVQYQHLLQTIPFSPDTQLSWLDRDIKAMIEIGTSFIHAMLTEDSAEAAKVMHSFASNLDSMVKRTEYRGTRAAPDYDWALFFTSAMYEHVYDEYYNFPRYV
jgi:hypothetical protein